MQKPVNRRDLLRGVLGAAAAIPLMPTMVGGCAAETVENDLGAYWKPRFTGDEIMDNQVLWYLGQATQGATDVLECLRAASQIAPGDEASWFAGWMRLADDVRARSDAHLAQGHRRSAATSLFRASNYYRAALIRYPEPTDPRLLLATNASEETFARALELLGVAARTVRIPYERTTLPGTVFLSPRPVENPATLLVHQGFHAFPEETMWVVNGALDRGHHCVIFHGPGQGLVLRQQAIPFRHDWEKVVTPAVDFVVQQSDLNPDKIVLMGLSFGGALAPRAAAFERRLAGLIANPGVLDWHAALMRKLAEFPGLEDLLTTSPETFNATVGTIVKSNSAARWWFQDAMWKHGASSPSDLLEKLRPFTNVDVVDRIGCKTLVMDGTAEDVSPGEAQSLFDKLKCPKTFLQFDEMDTGLNHCQGGALMVAQERMFDWVDESI